MLIDWLAAVFSHPNPLGALIIAGKTAVIYVFLLVGLRLLGKRELGQMTVYDLVLIVVLANSVQNAMVGNDTTLVGGIVSACTLLLLNRFFTALLVANPRFEHFAAGEPVLLVRDGNMLRENMRKEGITPELVMAALREHGIGGINEVQMAVLEVDGTISVVPKQATVYRTRHHFRALRVT